MIRVMIVDDNPIVVESLSKTVPWESVGCELAATATDGESGLMKVREVRPDILLLDIKMPGMDGLEMARHVLREADPPPVLMIITSHAEFGYAQEAIKLGAFNYITKPIDNDELLDNLRKAADKLLSERRHQDVVEQMKQSNQRKERIISQSFDQILHTFLRECADGGIAGDEAEERAKLLNIGGPYYVSCIASQKNSEAFFENVRQVAGTISNPKALLAPLKRERYVALITFILDPDCNGMEVTQENMRRMLRTLGEDEDYRFALGPKQDELSQLPEALRTLSLRVAPEIYDIQGKPAHLPETLQWEDCSPIVRRSIKFIEENIDMQLNLTTVANSVRLTPYYLSSLIRRETGMRYSDLVVSMKMGRAKEILKDPVIRVYEVGLLLGYEEYAHFYKVFKKVTGLSPNEYRKLNG